MLVTREEMENFYRQYIACLNSQDWQNLHRYVADRVRYNGKTIGLAGYRAMLVEDFRATPDLVFTIVRLACDPPIVASGLAFDCTPTGRLFGLPVNGSRVRFDENVFYEIEDGRIEDVWSVIDKAAIAAQI